ncbi:MAG TPA: helix-turn-helix domain-containing protein [bacterium]|nr:helix-turn-helix domain-containing protein [bacterium]
MAARATPVSALRVRKGPGSAEPFRRALSAARRAAGLTQAALAARLGTTQSAIARLERGEVAPTITTLSRLADALGIQFEVLPRSGIVVRETSPGLTLADLRARRDDLLAIAARHGARHVRVFGSVARGDARPDSDVDFLVEFAPGRTVLDLSGLILDLEETLGRKVNVVEVRRPSPAAERIRHEAVPL